MKKILLILILAILVLGFGCAPRSFLENPAKESKEKTTEVTETVKEETKTTEDQSYMKLIDKAKSYQSLSYDIGEDALTRRLYTVYLKGDNMKLALPDYVHIGNREYYDTVYLNKAANEALAYCESREKYFCPDNNKQYKVKYNEYIHKSPFVWLSEVQNPTYVGVEVINFRETTKLSYLKNNKDAFIWIDNFYGLPIKVLEPSGKSWFFNYININNLKDTEVIHS